MCTAYATNDNIKPEKKDKKGEKKELYQVVSVS